MSELTRHYDWARSPVGRPDQWPCSLRTTVNLLLASRFPMFLWWGPQLIQFYNDAYRPSLGNQGKHPTALGQPGAECWPEIWSTIKPLIDQVLAGGESVWLEDQLIPIFRNGHLEDVYWTSSYSPVPDDAGRVAGVLVVCQETTQQVRQTQQIRQEQHLLTASLQQQQERLRTIVNHAPVGLGLLRGADHIFELVNERLAQMAGRTVEQMQGRALLEALPELARQGLSEVFDQVRATGQPFEAAPLPVTLERNGRLETAFFQARFEPVHEPDGSISIVNFSQDITDELHIRQSLEASEARFRTLVEQAPVATCLFVGPQMRIEVANPLMIDYFGQGPSILGKPIRAVLTQPKDEPALALLDQVFTSGQAFEAQAAPADLVIYGVAGTYYFDFSLKPLFDEAGAVYAIMQVAVDVTQQVLARQETEQAQERLRQSEERQAFLLRLSDRLRSLSDPGAIQYQAACALGEYLGASRVGYAEDWGDGETIAVTRNYVNGVPSLEGRYSYDDYGPELLQSFRAGRTVVRPDIAGDPTLTEAEKLAHSVLRLGATVNKPLVKAGQLLAVLFIHYQEPHHFSEQELTLLEETAERTWAAVERAHAEEALRQSEARLQKAIAAETVGVLFFRLDGRIQHANQAFTRMSGYSRDQLLKAVHWQMLTDPQYWDITARSAENLGSRGETPPYEKRMLRPDGSMWWGLFAPTRLSGEGDASECIEFIIDITDRKQAETSLQESEERYRRLSIELDERVQARTQELRQANQDLTRSNDNLQQFAYVASHDLQEPLRKIQSFSTLLKEQYGAQLGDTGQDLLQRMSTASARMSTLIRDLLAYSRIATRQQHFNQVSLNTIVQDVLTTLEVVIAERGAQVVVDELPLVKGDESQLGQLFQNLLANALKFTPPKETPRIQITSELRRRDELPAEVKPIREADRFYQISVRDEGVGFDPKYRDRIFGVFQRLHGRNEFPGTGVGLAICQRVVENHGGAITAVSEPGKGAVFIAFLPIY